MRENLRGQVFGRLTVIGHLPSTTDGHIMYRCKCSCGNTKDVKKPNLVNNKTRSCGCLHRQAVKTNGRIAARAYIQKYGSSFVSRGMKYKRFDW